MTLKAIILRCEGALIDSDELQRQAFVRLFAELGYDWPCSRRDFAELRTLPTREERLDRFVRKQLKPRPSVDLTTLITMMQRRLVSIIAQMLDEQAVPLRAGVRDLTVAAKADGLPIALVTTGPRQDVERLITASLGACARNFDRIVSAPDAAEAYRLALEQLDVAPHQCLAIDSCADGLRAATDAKLRVIVTRNSYAATDVLDEAQFVVDCLPALVRPSSAGAHEPLTSADRAELVAALNRLHAGIVDLDGVFVRSTTMKVSEILKSKVSQTVKSIGATETIWALSHRLKADAIGALVVMRADGSIEGIISERDVARGLAEHGADLPSKLVGDLMTKTVITCSPDDTVSGISRVMSQRRIRHLPVLQEGKVVGLISIGDVLSHRLDQMQREVNVLRDYAISKS